MPRKPRFNSPGVVYHLISRFVDRDWFIESDAERELYLTLLARALSESDWRCLAYAVMSNHLHLAAIAGQEPLDSWIRRVHSPFADSLNRSRGRIGSIFVRGPKDFATPSHRVGRLLAYIHNNPVRAKVVERAADSTWTSHRAYIGLDPTPRWLHVDEGLARAAIRRGDFDEWVSFGKNELVGDEQLDPAPTEGIDRAPCPRLRIAARDPDDVVRVTAEELGTTVSDLRSRRRGPLQLLGRRVAARCGDECGLSGVAIATALGMSQQRVSVLLRRSIEQPEVQDVGARVLARLGLGLGLGSDTRSLLAGDLLGPLGLRGQK